MKKIKLTQDKYALVDDEVFDYFNQFKWHFDGRYASRHIKRKKIYLHQLILVAEKPLVIDHINGDPLDNRTSNLRRVSQRENGFNRTSKNTNNSSGFRGVSWNKGRHGWDAYIKINYKKIFLGRFHSIQVAWLARRWGERTYGY